MRKLLHSLFLLVSVVCLAQTKPAYSDVDSKMAKIPLELSASTTGIAKFISDNFKTDSDKIRAVFYWTTINISYDVPNMFVPNQLESPQEKIEKTLKTRKGVCIHYAEVFNDISNKIGIKSRIIEGYTKQNGAIATIAHAWCAAKIDNKWLVFDPTWGAGGVQNGKFVRKLNNTFFKAEPSKIIASHMPFDYMWQFLNYPVTNAEFYAGKIQVDKTKKYFDFEKEIDRYEKASETDQLFESAARIEKNGIKNNLILEYYNVKKKQWNAVMQNTNVDKMNAIVAEFNEAVLQLNDFIMYRNNKFKPTFSDEKISQMIQIPREKLTKCQNDIFKISMVGTENASNLMALKNTIADAVVQAEDNAAFVKNYLNKSKLVRKTMFSKVSWFGIPLN
ncbi:transglutaminase domain-containing protein [Flavobacterium flavipallidum]|uniref:Transglutaminase domain-containing protein n=1 Tax=Flavobacterium flavipallidum TaxID=3139140 RepID=A0ABU9HHV3_9FLAO